MDSITSVRGGVDRDARVERACPRRNVAAERYGITFLPTSESALSRLVLSTKTQGFDALYYILFSPTRPPPPVYI